MTACMGGGWITIGTCSLFVRGGLTESATSLAAKVARLHRPAVARIGRPWRLQ